MELNLEKKQQLEKLLVKPSLATQEHIPFLQQLIETFPYYQPLYLLLAKASSRTEDKDKAFTKAALYTNGSILHRIIHEQNLNAIEDINVIAYEPWVSNQSVEFDSKQQAPEAAETTPNVAPLEVVEITESELTNPSINEEILSEELEKPTEETFTSSSEVDHQEFVLPQIENLEPLANEVILTEEPEINAIIDEETPAIIMQANQDFVLPQIENLEPLPNEVILTEEPEINEVINEETPAVIPQANQDFVLPQIENLEPLHSEIIKVCEIEEQFPETREADEQEVFEEINEFIAPPELILAQQTDAIDDAHVADLVKSEEEEEVSSPNDTEEELIIETVAATDFFAFDRNFNTEAIAEPETEVVPNEVISEPITNVDSSPENIVSKYDDDQLPFTFLWWLAKTRKDHEQIFRPFASPVTANAQPLQQQYVEHIFHIQAPLEPIEEEPQAALVPTTKENEIIDKFIKSDPQIKALKPDQINNENKAKRSSEDSNDVVSETLAQIYIEQMLYHKAIDTYQKLSLKFPEKSGYFADLIQSLEKKI